MAINLEEILKRAAFGDSANADTAIELSKGMTPSRIESSQDDIALRNKEQRAVQELADKAAAAEIAAHEGDLDGGTVGYENFPRQKKQMLSDEQRRLLGKVAFVNATAMPGSVSNIARGYGMYNALKGLGGMFNFGKSTDAVTANDKKKDNNNGTEGGGGGTGGGGTGGGGPIVSRETKETPEFDLGKLVSSPAGLLAIAAVGRAIAGNEAKRLGSDQPIFDYARGLTGFLEGKSEAEATKRKELLEKQKLAVERKKAEKEGRDVEYDKYMQVYSKVVQDAALVDPIARVNEIKERYPNIDDTTARQYSTQLLAYDRLDENLKRKWRENNPRLAAVLDSGSSAGGQDAVIADTTKKDTNDTGKGITVGSFKNVRVK